MPDVPKQMPLSEEVCKVEKLPKQMPISDDRLKMQTLSGHWNAHEKSNDSKLPNNWDAPFIGKDISFKGGGSINQPRDLVLNVSSHLATHGGRMMVVCSRQHVEDMDQTSNVQYM